MMKQALNPESISKNLFNLIKLLMSQYLGVTETINLAVPKQYPIVLLLIGGTTMLQHYSTLAYLALRKRIYGQVKYMDNYKEDHHIAFEDQKKIHPYGDPDAVDGWYSKLLSYREWYRLACAKRAHQEQVENSGVAIVF